MASIFSSVTRPETSSLLGRFSTGRTPQPHDVRLHAILSAIDDALQRGGTLGTMLETLEESKRTLFEFLRAHCSSPVVAKAVTLKAINIVLAKQHFKARSRAVMSRPVGLIIDPSSSCNLACPGCVHSPTVKARKIFDWGVGSDNIRQYFLAMNRTLFNRESLAVLSPW